MRNRGNYLSEEEDRYGPDYRKHCKKTKGKTNGIKQRFKLLNDFVGETLRSLTRSEMATWIVLYRHSQNDKVSLSQRQIAKQVGCTLKAVNTAVKSLTQKGLLSVLRQGKFKGPDVVGDTSVYRVKARIRNNGSE